MKKLNVILLAIPIVFYAVFRSKRYTFKNNLLVENTRIINTDCFDNVHPDIGRSTKRINLTDFQTYITNSHFVFDCTNIPFITIKRMLGNGISKQGYLGEYNGSRVVVKVTSSNLDLVKICIKKMTEARVKEIISLCNAFIEANFLFEIILLHELHHPNIAPLLGYCVKGTAHSDNVIQKDVVAVYEYGETVTLRYLVNTNWQERLKHAIELADLMLYFEMSPLGSLLYSDFKIPHFYLINSRMKVSDLDSIKGEMRVDADKPCPIGVKVDKQCIGYNAGVNYKQMNRLFSKALLDPVAYPPVIADKIQQVRNRAFSNQSNAHQRVKELKNILMIDI